LAHLEENADENVTHFNLWAHAQCLCT